MSRLKNLKKDNKKNNPSLLDALQMIDPSNKNTYLDFLFKQIKKRSTDKEYEERVNLHKNELKEYFCVSEEKIKTYNDIEIMTNSTIISFWFGYSEIQTLCKFNQEKEKGRLGSVDINRINDFQDINNILNLLDLKDIGVSLKKQIYRHYEDEEWLIILPLTYLSSKKYGSNTKWCTTHNNHDYFKRYATKGNIIYTINKQTGHKVATFYSLKKSEPELSFWDSTDNRIDSMGCGLPIKILGEIKNFIDNSTKSNLSMLDEEEFKKEMNYYKQLESQYAVITEPILINDPIPIEIPRVEFPQEPIEIHGLIEPLPEI